MTAEEYTSAVKQKSNVIHEQGKIIKAVSKALVKEKATKKISLLDVLEENAKDNDVYNMAYELVKAHKSNALQRLPSFALEAAKSLVHNCLAKGKNGHRHKENIHQFFEVLLIWGKPRVVKWVCNNLYDINIDTVRADVRKIKIYEFGVLESSFIAAASVYKKLMAKKEIVPGSVLCEHSEDETAVVREVVYEAKSKTNHKNQLFGF